MGEHFLMVKCPVCKNKFHPAPQHAYKIGKGNGKLVCSYHCQRDWEKEHKFKRKGDK